MACQAAGRQEEEEEEEEDVSSASLVSVHHANVRGMAKGEIWDGMESVVISPEAGWTLHLSASVVPNHRGGHEN